MLLMCKSGAFVQWRRLFEALKFFHRKNSRTRISRTAAVERPAGARPLMALVISPTPPLNSREFGTPRWRLSDKEHTGCRHRRTGAADLIQVVIPVGNRGSRLNTSPWSATASGRIGAESAVHRLNWAPCPSSFCRPLFHGGICRHGRRGNPVGQIKSAGWPFRWPASACS